MEEKKEVILHFDVNETILARDGAGKKSLHGQLLFPPLSTSFTPLLFSSLLFPLTVNGIIVHPCLPSRRLFGEHAIEELLGRFGG
jgi:hypothetical protein